MNNKSSAAQGFSLGVVIWAFSAVMIIFLIAVGVFFIKNKSKQAPVEMIPDEIVEEATTTQTNTNRLPDENNGGLDSDAGEASGLQAEKITFADYYKKIDEKIEVKERFKLPINIKTDVANYYDIARVVNLEKQVPELNEKGQAPIDNFLGSKAINFYQSYDLLAKTNFPMLLTSDFMIYYYQLALEDIYSKVKSNIFYQEIWDVNKKLYKVADERFRIESEKSKGKNNPVLEGTRLEAAYFAVALELLKPRPDQINPEGIKNANKFSIDEQGSFIFNVPDYLSEIVNKELTLIKEGKEAGFSPIFLYKKNYTGYVAPDMITRDSRLKNFYQVTKWMNSVFPLYFRGDNCPDCLLDKDDWTISAVASILIAEDFSKNQISKNKWAKIYKGVSFFEGLRQELTYLHYYDAINKAFGSEYKIEEVLPAERTALEKNLLKLQTELAGYQFSPIQGGLDRADEGDRAIIGMRMLQDIYWPNEYIFEQLIYPYVTTYEGAGMNVKKNVNSPENITLCSGKDGASRCRGFGLDIAGLIHEFPDADAYFKVNTEYKNYEKQRLKLIGQLDDFSSGTWRNSSYWSVLNLGRSIFDTGQASSHFNADNWRDRNINTFLGSWVNLQVSKETLTNRWEQDNPIDLSEGVNYIEPNIRLINELLANAIMLKDGLTAFRAISENDSAGTSISSLIGSLQQAQIIVKKELSGEDLDIADSKAIIDIAEKFTVNNIAKKFITLSFPGRGKPLVESINGVRFVAYVYEQSGKKFLAFGPIFNYQEAK